MMFKVKVKCTVLPGYYDVKEYSGIEHATMESAHKEANEARAKRIYVAVWVEANC